MGKCFTSNVFGAVFAKPFADWMLSLFIMVPYTAKTTSSNSLRLRGTTTKDSASRLRNKFLKRRKRNNNNTKVYLRIDIFTIKKKKNM